MGMHLLFAVKSKKDFLKVLHYYITQRSEINFISSITVVDMDDNIYLGEYCAKYKVKYIGIYRDFFNKSTAINLGISYLFDMFPDDYVLICDADVVISVDSLKVIYSEKANVILKSVTESDTNIKRDAFGIIKCKIKNIYVVDGYDSHFKGWGFEDHDIIWRLTHHGFEFKKMESGIHLSHGDDERTQFYHSTDLKQMRMINKLYYEKKVESKNTSGTLTKDIKLLQHGK